MSPARKKVKGQSLGSDKVLGVEVSGLLYQGKISVVDSRLPRMDDKVRTKRTV